MLRTWGRRFDSFRGYQHMVHVVKRLRPRVVIPICVGSNPIMHPKINNIYTMNNYCAIPFNHVSVGNNGDYQICCMHQVPEASKQNINHTSVVQWQNNAYLKEIQSAFVSDKKHPGCGHCWQQEASGVTSVRQTQAQEYRILGARPRQRKLLNVEVAVGNLCNLSCLMCNEYNSSAILAENRKLQLTNRNQQNFSWSNTAFENLKQILNLSPRVLNLRGGEPLYNKSILELIETFPEHKLHNTLLHITTNATTWSVEWQHALSKFKTVRVMLSVDGIGELGEYIRYPSSWSQVEYNIIQIAQCKNIKPVIHTTVQNLNIMYLGDIIAWCKQNKIYLMLDGLVNPDYLEMTNLPPTLKQKCIEQLSQVLLQDLDPHIRTEITAYQTAMQTSSQQFNQELWQKFINNISLRDKLRGNTHKKFLVY